MPQGIINRVADNWHSLLAVADLVGGAWPARARRAAINVVAESDDQGSVRMALLSDIRAAFAARAEDRMTSEDLVAYLGSLDDRPWPEFRNGKPITKTQVARLLRPLRISSGTIRLDGGRTAKGYYRPAFDDAFDRYLPPEQNVTTSQDGGCDVSENPRTPSVSAGCDVVTDREHPSDEISDADIPAEEERVI
jgi:putative DNA primase/helicase